ncbi:MAG TPA: hypothetical protein VFN41_15130 [Candidatus Limnocylindrales bacterium]|nr:hypothetical protein [Candidatus Limnocylindrales bacterium]
MLRPLVALGALVLVVVVSIVAVMALARPPAPSPTPSRPPASGGPSPSASTAPSDGSVAPPTGITFPDFVVDPTAVRSPTTSTAQSKLWYADGRWWAAMFGPTTNRLGIFTLDPRTQVWSDTGTLIDERPIADTDMLSAGSTLWAVSGGSRATDNHAIRVRRFSYDAKAKRYSLDPDFPVTIRPTGASPAVIALDSKGTAWVAYAADGKVWITHTLASPTSWSAPVAFTAQEAAIDVTDVASIVAYGPGRIGVAWTNQRSGIYFASHDDSTPDDQWSTVESILPGARPDPQLNLTTYPLTDGGTDVAAAVSTTNDQSAVGRTLDALTLVATRDPSGEWRTAVAGLVRDRHTRPIVLVDPTNRTIAIAATSPGGGGVIYYKRASLDQIEFDTGLGVPLIASTQQTTVDNVTSTKGPLTPESGLLVLAHDRTSGMYLHGVVPLGGAPPTADPADASRPKLPTPPPKATTTTLMHDTFEPSPVGTTVPAAWYTRPEDPKGRMSIVAGPAARALRVASAARTNVRACRDFSDVPGTTLSVDILVKLSRVALEDATILSMRGSGGESASIRVTSKSVFAWFNGPVKIRTTAAFKAGAWYRVRTTIDQTRKTYSVRIDNTGGRLIARASGLRWRARAVPSVKSICVETAPAPPSQTIDIAEVRVTQVVTP